MENKPQKFSIGPIFSRRPSDFTPFLRGSLSLVLVPHEDYLINPPGMARAQMSAAVANAAIRKMMEAAVGH